MSRTGSAFVLAAIVILVGLLLVGTDMLAGRARAHDAIPTAAQPQGWSYPPECCSGYDCRQLARADIVEGPDGYVVPSGEVVPMTDRRVRVSPDGEFHWCSVGGRPDGRTICLFAPFGGS